MSFVIASVGLSAFQQIQAGKYAKGQADLQASQMDYQGQVERANALETARIIRKAGRRQEGETTAAYAGAGVRVDQGSAVDAQKQVTKDVEHDAYQALLDGNRRGRGMETGATMQRIDGSLKQSAGYVNAAGSALQAGAMGMRSSGWRTNGPGFSGQQAPAPVTTLTPRAVGSY